MEIDFIHQGGAYLPELQAYIAFLRQTGHVGRVHLSPQTVSNEASIVWWMCGRVSSDMAQKFPSALHVHEYSSASIPPLAWCKDQFKRWTQATPHYRIFQNAWVHDRMAFNDAIPFEFRDMGVGGNFFRPNVKSAVEFDGVYLGEMSRLLHFESLIEAFVSNGRRLLLIGELSKKLSIQIERNPGIVVTGRVAHEYVPELLSRARFGLNLVPSCEPYIFQTSTKLLEYCAVGIPVISTDYPWVRQFESLHNARFGYIQACDTFGNYQKILENLMKDRAFYQVPDLSMLQWPDLLLKLRIWSYLSRA